MVPELQAPVLEVDVWIVESLLTHLTESPTFTVIGFGEYAVVVSANEPGTMLAVVVAPAVIGRAGSPTFAQDKDRDARRFDSAQDRPFDSAQGRRREMTVLAGRGAGIGVRIADRAEGGVAVEDVQSGSPADKARLQPDKIISHINGRPVMSPREFYRMMADLHGDVELTVRRTEGGFDKVTLKID